MPISPSYLCIDLKSFYASVECAQRKLDPLTTNLLVADRGRTDKTICLAVSPSLKALGIPSRPRLFEAKQKIREAEIRLGRKISYIVAPPRMALYIEYSCRIYSVYLKYLAPEDIHIYSIDEVFMDVTNYLSFYDMDPKKLAAAILRDVLETTSITASAGLGTNLYLAKIAMDILAKQALPDEYGSRIACLDEITYRHLLWKHTPLTDFWRIGSGTAKTLHSHGIQTMGDLAAFSLTDEEYLYRLFGVDAEILIDHAWGLEPCTMADIKQYIPTASSLNSGQVLPRPYNFQEGRLILREMAYEMSLALLDKGLVTDTMTIYIGYDKDTASNGNHTDPTCLDHYGRRLPRHTGATSHLGAATNSASLITKKLEDIYLSTTRPDLMIRRLFLTARNVRPESSSYCQLDLFSDTERMEREKRLHRSLLQIHHRYGKNAVFRGLNLLKEGRTLERNSQIGGHKA